MKDRGMMGPLDIIGEINRQFDKAILVTDVGQHQMLVSQYADITENRQLIMSGGLGTMGYGLPGAIGAKIGNPDTPVISVSGDGGMQMNIQELATAVLEELPIICCIFNNEYLGMVRQWQKLFLRQTLRYDQFKSRCTLPPYRWGRISGIHTGLSSGLQRVTALRAFVSQRKIRLQLPLKKQRKTPRHLQSLNSSLTLRKWFIL